MRIRQTLQLSAAVSLASLVLLAAAIVGIQHRESQYAAASENMNGAVRTISLMRGLPHDLTGEWHLRATQQWKIQHANLTRTLDTIPTVNADAHALKLRLRDDNAAIATFFAALSSARPNMRPKEALLLIAAQLDVRTASMASDILTMDDMTAAYFDRQKQWLRFMTVVLIVILAGIIGGLLWILYSRVIVPIVMLGNASAIVSAGQLDQPILVTGSNEVTTLARSFETMRVSLQDRMRDLDAEIRKLRDSEQRLRLNEANLAITLNSIGDAVIATDAQGCITRMNPVAERLTDWPLADALGQPLTAVFHIISAETRLPSANPVQRVMEHGQVVGLANHTALLARDGNEYQIADSAAPIRDGTDAIVGVVLVFSDVTEKYRAEEVLRRSEAEVRQQLREIEQIYAYSPIGLFIFDREYRFQRINERMAEINGFSVAHHLGKTLDEIVPDLAGFLKEAYRPIYERGEPVLNVAIHGKTPGDPDHAHDWIGNYFPLKSETGEVIGLIGAVLEITELKQAEQAMQESLKEKTALLNEVHHRVKNNLQVITSLLRLEAGRSSQPDTKAVLGDMQGRIRSMSLLHETLYRSGTFASIDLGSYLKQLATQSFRALLTGSGAVQLRLELASVTVSMDQATPCGLLVNELISNSLKHGFPDGRSGEVRIELQAIDGGPQVRLRMSDTGVGLPHDFEAKRGNSLGLQLVTDLAKQLGGTVEIGAGPGAEFSVMFMVDELKLTVKNAV